MCYEIINTKFSYDNKYRYLLVAKINSESNNELVVIQMNPSNASTIKSDPTVGKVCNWAYENNYGKVFFLNLFAFKESKQENIPNINYDELVGLENDNYLKESCTKTRDIVFAWGAPDGNLIQSYIRRTTEVFALLKTRKIFSVGGLSYGKYPRHGLSWNKNNREKRLLKLEDII